MLSRFVVTSGPTLEFLLKLNAGLEGYSRRREGTRDRDQTGSHDGGKAEHSVAMCVYVCEVEVNVCVQSNERTVYVVTGTRVSDGCMMVR